jgi:PKHD-type hydroxylase
MINEDPMTNTFKLLGSVSNRTENNTISMQGIVEGFFTREECREIIILSEAIAERTGGTGENNTASAKRKSNVKFILPSAESNWIFDKLEVALTHMNQAYHFNLLGFFEGVQIASYSGGGFYDWHMDLGAGRNSNRKLSMSIQLSDPDDYEGGELEFLNIEESVPKDIGSLIGGCKFFCVNGLFVYRTGILPSNSIVNRFSAAFQSRIGMVHFLAMLRSAK